MKKWLLYYGSVLLIVLAIALIAPQAVTLHLASLVPLACMGILLLSTSKWVQTNGSHRTDHGPRFVKINGQKGYFQESNGKTVLPFEKNSRHIWLAARLIAPIYIPFMVFFAPLSKLWTILLTMVFGMVAIVYSAVYWFNEAQKATIQKEEILREQQRREEQGKWK